MLALKRFTTREALLIALGRFLGDFGKSCERDKEMYGNILSCVLDNGFLLRQEKSFLINYALLLALGEFTTH